MKPGLVFWGLKQPEMMESLGIERKGTIFMPKRIVDELCETSDKFESILIK